MGRKKLKVGEESSHETRQEVDFKSVIEEHLIFFDKLIDLIPARFYLPTDGKEKPWFQGLSKDEKAKAKEESKENIKLARMIRLDPEKSTATLDLLKQSLQNEKSTDEKESADDETDFKSMASGLDDDNRSVTYEELRQRLRRKIEELRGNRNNGTSERAKMRHEKKEIQQKKRKRDSDSKDKKPTIVKKSEGELKKDVEEASKGLTFGHIKLGDEEEHGKKKKRKISKFKELEKAEKLQEAKKDPEKGEIIAKKHSWNAAASRAAGVKVHDDPKLLKQKLRKERRNRQKNAEKWKERIQTTRKMKDEKQQKRSDNITERARQKKQRKIEKREKKLLRPGFEGRKEGFINESST